MDTKEMQIHDLSTPYHAVHGHAITVSFVSIVSFVVQDLSSK